MYDLAVVNGQLWVNGGWRRGNVCVKDGVIAAVTESIPEARQTLDAAGRFVLPGLIDSHVHLCPPGAQNSSSDNFYTGSLAAVRGGATTLIDFTGEASTPDEVDGLFHKRMDEAAGSLVDYAFHASFTQPENADQMVARSLGHGMPSVKMYTTYRIASDDKHILAVLKRTAQRDVMLNLHTENDALVYPEIAEMERFGQRRPDICERSAVALYAEMTSWAKGLFYLVHMSCGSTVEMLQSRYPDLLGTSFILESCPHYFLLDEAAYRRPNAKLFTMTPPLRSREEREALGRALGSIRTLSTDHCPFLKGMKNAPIDSLPMGIGGLGYSFAQMHRLYGDEVIDRFTKNQADTHGLARKGRIAEGLDADLAVFEPIAPTRVSDLRGACDYSVYTGFEEKLRFTDVLRRGEWLMRDGVINIHASRGRYQFRSL